MLKSRKLSDGSQIYNRRDSTFFGVEEKDIGNWTNRLEIT